MPFRVGSRGLVNPDVPSVDELPAAALVDPRNLLPGIQFLPEGVGYQIHLTVNSSGTGPQDWIAVAVDQVDLIEGPPRLRKGLIQQVMGAAAMALVQST